MGTREVRILLGLPDKDLPFERFLDSLGEACLLVTPSGHILGSNQAARALYGVGADSLHGRRLMDLCAEEERGRVGAHLEECNGTSRAFTARQHLDDGTSFVGSFTAKRHVHHDESERLTVIIRRLEEELKTCNSDLQLHHLMLESALDGVVAHTLDGELLYANTAALSQWDLTLEDVRRRGRWGWISPASRDTVAQQMAVLTEQGSARFEISSADREAYGHVEVNARLVEGPTGHIVVSTVRDISERLQTEEMVRYLAYHDTLTGLANRVLLHQDLFHAISTAKRHGDVLGVAYIDLDSFKPVNDTYGHAIGDEVLREVADRISGCVRDGDTVARVGGDEFVIVLPRISDPSALEVVAAKLCEEVSRPIEVNGAVVLVTASIGTAVYAPGDDAESLLTRADLGMYESRGLTVDTSDLDAEVT